MNISHLMLQGLDNNKYDRSKLFEVGSIIEGKVIETTGDKIVLDVGNGNHLNALYKTTVSISKNDILKLLVKTANESKIVLMPIDDNMTSQSSKEQLINNILLNNGLKVSKNNIEIVKNLIKFKIPVNKDILNKSTKLASKIESLINMGKEDSIQLINKNEDPLKVEITKLLKTSFIQEDQGIRDIGLESKANKINKGDITELVKKEINTIIKNNKLSSKLIRNTLFLLKCNKEVSIKNLKLLTQLLEGNNFIEDDIEKLNVLFENKDDIKPEMKGVINKYNTKSNLRFTHKDKENIKNFYKKIYEEINIIKEKISQKHRNSNKIHEKLESINSKIEFLNELNENMTLMYLPMKMNKEDFKEKLYVLNKRKGNKEIDNFKIFLSINTVNLKKVEILCEIIKDKLLLTFNLEDENIVDLFKENQNILKNELNKSGFKNISMIFKKGEEIDILDGFEDKDQSKYILDVRV